MLRAYRGRRGQVEELGCGVHGCAAVKVHRRQRVHRVARCNWPTLQAVPQEFTSEVYETSGGMRMAEVGGLVWCARAPG